MQQDILEWLVVVYACWAMILDLARSRISNRYLLFGWTAGAAVHILQPAVHGWFQFLGGCILPILLLFILFYFKMMGAGDIKLLSVLGGMIGMKAVLPLIICSFLIGGILSIGILTVKRSWSARFRFFYRYFYNYIATGSRIPYRPEVSGAFGLHFAVPVFLTVLLWKGGLF